MHCCDRGRCRHHPAKRPGQRVVTNEGRHGRPTTVTVVIPQPNRLHRAMCIDRGLEHRRPESALAEAAERRAFGKDDNRLARPQSSGYGVDDRGQPPKARSLDRNDPHGPGEEPEAPPTQYVSPCDKRSWHHGADDEDIQPGDVVSDDQHSSHVANGTARQHDAHPEATQRHAAVAAMHPRRKGQCERRKRTCQEQRRHGARHCPQPARRDALGT